MEAELVNQLSTVIASGAGGYFAGWGLGKVVKIALKIMAGVAGGFIAVLMYMNSQGLVQVQWDKFQVISNNLVSWVTSNPILNDSSLSHTVSGLGMGSVTGFIPAFIFGLMKGVRG